MFGTVAVTPVPGAPTIYLDGKLATESRAGNRFVTARLVLAPTLSHQDANRMQVIDCSLGKYVQLCGFLSHPNPKTQKLPIPPRTL